MRSTAPIPKLPSAPKLGLVAAFIVYGCASTGSTDGIGILESSRVAITRDGKVIGTSERVVREIEAGRQFTTRQTMTVAFPDARPRTLVEERTRTEDHDQSTVAIEHRSKIGAYETLTSAEISNDVAVVRRESRAEGARIARAGGDC